ncbi:helix-turn-helix domain-containing protein [Loigolactobacillus zhaoyuanensis]|uniref:Helix-turn-helix domain-containing protein n=1 Tax=Loigolactobacillus zhaoyuanensis TaxID=2486017 RepID=A0ABW8UCA9_9LACO
MNLSKQIQSYRKAHGLSQEDLATRIYVSRQTISNWETGHSYPDVENLLLLSVLFDVSLDELVKGDVTIMKRKIMQTRMDQYTKIMLLFMVLGLISVGPSLFLPDYWWLVMPVVLWSSGLFFAFKLEKIKHEEDIQNYQEIIAFMADKNLDVIRTKRKWAKDRLYKTLIVTIFIMISGLIVFFSALPYLMTH